VRMDSIHQENETVKGRIGERVDGIASSGIESILNPNPA
jgi:hypothetical protein